MQSEQIRNIYEIINKIMIKGEEIMNKANNINTTKNIQKPLSVVMVETRDMIVNTLNATQMHPTLLEMILKDIYAEVQAQARLMLENEAAEYQRMLNEAQESDSDVENE